MKAVIIVIAIWTWLTLNTSGQDIRLVVSKETTQKDYADFLTLVRNAVEAKVIEKKVTKTKTCHGLPMASGLTAKPEFVEVKLQAASSGNVIRLGFQRSDLYLEGYADLYKGKCRYRIFTDSNANIKSFLCGTVKQPSGVNDIRYDKNYLSIERAAGIARSQLALGMKNLEEEIKNIYGKTKKDDSDYGKNEARFLLLATQMVAEATRFKYIEDKIKQNIKSGYKPKPIAISLEGKWDKVSELIAAQTDPNKPFTMPKGMQDEKGEPWTTDTVNNLKSNYISLLTYVSNCKVKSPIVYFLTNYPSSMIAMWD